MYLLHSYLLYFIISYLCFYRSRTARLTRSGSTLSRFPSKGTNINPFTPGELVNRTKRNREESERLEYMDV